MIKVKTYLETTARLIMLAGVFFSYLPNYSFAVTKDSIIDAIDYKLLVREYTIPGTLRGGGGSLVIKDNTIIYARAQNDFVGIDLNEFKSKNIKHNSSSERLLILKENFLPKIITNESSLARSGRYPSPEFLPKIEDFLYYDGAFYCTHTFYDSSSDDIFFMVSMLREGEFAWKTIFRSPALDAPYLAKGIGGALAAKDRVLFVSVGDFSLDRVNGLPNDLASQNPTLPWGKILAIELFGEYPYSIFSMGHRNPQGLLFLANGKLLESEHGPRGGDELNIIDKGGNYGWPYLSYGTQYGTQLPYSRNIPPPADGIKFIEPLYAFLPSAAITGMSQLQGFSKKWDGDVILGSLKAQSLFRVRIIKNRVLFVEPLLVSHRVRKVRQHRNFIYVLTDFGTILRVQILK